MTEGVGGASGPGTTKDTEIELKLAIRSRVPADVMEAVARLEGVEGFRFLTLPTVRIRDSYLELPGGGRAAGGGRFALRRREMDDRSFLTLKGEGASLTGAGSGANAGVVRRLEIEVAESEAGWRRIREALGEAGVRVTEGLEGLHALRSFQLRETNRVRRAVVARHGSEHALAASRSMADLTLDTVELDVAGRRIRFCEVEVEAQTGVDEPAHLVAAIGAALRDIIGPALLRPWSLSKLATGIALEGLAESGELDGLVGEEGDLLPEGLDRIEGVRG